MYIKPGNYILNRLEYCQDFHIIKNFDPCINKYDTYVTLYHRGNCLPFSLSTLLRNNC